MKLIRYKLCFLSLIFGLISLNAQGVSKENISQATKHYKIASKKLEKGDNGAAVVEYKEAVKFNPNYVEAYNDMGVAYLRLGDYENTISSYDMALSIKPDYILSRNNKKSAQFNKAHALSDSGDKQGSLPYYLAAIDTDPNYVEAYNDLAMAYLNLENYDLAIANLNMALTVKPDYELARNNKANVYCKQGKRKLIDGDTKGAIRFYQEAISTSPNYIESYNDIAEAYVKFEDYNMAIIYLEKALAISPCSETTKESLALVYLKRGSKKAESGDSQGAISDFIESIASNPYCEEVYTKVSTLFRKLGNQNQSLQYEEKALIIKDIITKRNEAKHYYSEGTKKYGSQDYQGAILDYTKAISIYPDYFEAYNDRGSAYNFLRKSNKAIADFKMALQINPNYSIAQKNKELVEQYKRERLNNTLNLIGVGLNIASSTIDLVSDIKNPNTKDYSSPTTTPTLKTNLPTNSTHKDKVLCSLCNGTGAIDSYVATFGDTNQKWCEKCNKMMSAGHCHGCKTCPGCGGKGYR